MIEYNTVLEFRVLLEMLGQYMWSNGRDIRLGSSSVLIEEETDLGVFSL
jgi:hypothetical protein